MIILKFLRYAFVFLFFLFFGIFLAVHTPYVKNKAKVALKEAIYDAAGIHVDIHGVSFDFPRSVSIEGLSVCQDEEKGPFFTAKKVSIKVDLHALWEGRLEPISITLFGANLLSLPKVSETTPELPPLVVKIESLAINPAIVPSVEGITKLELKGTIKLDLQGKTLASGNVDAAINDKVRKMAVRLGFVLGQDLTLTSAYMGSINKEINFFGDLHVSSDRVLDGTTLHLEPATFVALGKALGQPIKQEGFLYADFMFTGTPDDIQTAITAGACKTTVGGTCIGPIETNASAHITPGQIAGNVEFTANADNRSIDGSFHYLWNGGKTIAFKAIQIDSPGITLNGDGDYFIDQMWAQGVIYGNVPDLAALNIPSIEDVNGKASFTAELSAVPTPSLFVDAEIPKLSVKDISLKKGRVQINVSNLFSDPVADIRFMAGKVGDSTFVFRNVEAATEIDPSLKMWPFSFSSSSQDAAAVFSSAGSWHWDQQVLTLGLERLQGRLAAVQFELREPTTFRKDNHGITFTPLTIDADIGTGSIIAHASYDGREISATTKIESLQIEELLPPAALLPIKGTVSGEITLSGPPEKPQGALSLDLSGFAYEETVGKKLPPAEGNLKAALRDSILSCSGSLTAAEQPPIHFECALPVMFSLAPPSFHFEDNQPITADVAAGGEITPLLHLFFGNAVPFSGRAYAHVAVMGTLASPEFSGSCDISDGFYEIPKIGVSLYEIAAHLEADGPAVQITTLTGNDGRGGTVSGSGNAVLNSAEHFPFHLDLELNNALLLNQDYITAICSGPMAFSGNAASGSIEGNLDLIEGSVVIPERPVAVINSVDVTYVNVPANEPPPQQMNVKKSSWPMNLNVHFNAAALSITGKDLKSKWHGAFAIQGTNAQPLLYGELKVISGQYLFNGNPFDIDKGTITFGGDLDKRTTMYVIASKDLDRVQVDVIAKGPVKNPEITFRSNPPLPQREILSWILFNRGTNEISPFQGTQLSESITNLKANQQGPDVLSKIRSTFGIDRFEIIRNQNPEADNEVDVQVGKYITDNVLISVIKSDVNSLAIEAALSNRIKLQAQVDEEAEGKLILKWKRNY